MAFAQYMNTCQQLIEDRQSAANAASLAFKTLIEKADTLNGGQRYALTMEYGSMKVEVYRLTEILRLLGSNAKPAREIY